MELILPSRDLMKLYGTIWKSLIIR